MFDDVRRQDEIKAGVAKWQGADIAEADRAQALGRTEPDGLLTGVETDDAVKTEFPQHSQIGSGARADVEHLGIRGYACSHEFPREQAATANEPPVRLLNFVFDLIGRSVHVTQSSPQASHPNNH
jgi:hypothetical protein